MCHTETDSRNFKYFIKTYFNLLLLHSLWFVELVQVNAWRLVTLFTIESMSFFRCVRYHSALKSQKKFIFWEAKLLCLKYQNHFFFLKISSYISKSIRFSGLLHYLYFHFRALWRYQLKIFVGGVLYLYTITHYILPVLFWIICKHKRREAEWQNKNNSKTFLTKISAATNK